ncbi:MAG: SDR family NAD(P)-dependent oxidoreductase, partial [Dehalococcoidia bacterium]
MGKLDGKVALITGAASGIGKASALRFHSDGAAVMCADMNLDGAKQTAAEIAERGGSAAAIELDVADPEAVRESLVRTARELGGLHIIYNNAGISGLNVAADGTMSMHSWEKVIAVNLTGVYNGLFYGCQALAERGGGAVVSTA